VAAGVEDGQRAEAELLLLLDEVGRQRHAPVLASRPSRAIARPRAGRAGAPSLQVLVVRLRHGQRLVERALDLGLNQPSIEVLMKFDAMMKIRIAGASASSRNARTSLA